MGKKEDVIEYGNIKLSPMQLDSLMELGNIGSGHAITALSQLLDRKIDVFLTSVDLIPFWELPDKFGGREVEVFGILSLVKEKQPLSILQIFAKESLINLVNIIAIDEKIDTQNMKSFLDLDEYLQSTIVELGNILSGHYANALADLMETKLVPDVPDVAFDSLGAIMDGVIAKSAEISDLMILINTKMAIEELDINGMLLFLPSPSGLKEIFKAINIE